MGLFRRPTALDPADVDRMKSDLAALRDELERHDATSTVMREQLTALDHRVTSVSTELANQLTELGHDLDALNARPVPNGLETEALAAVRDGQVKLANEQVRYQIAFREDLARLAQELQRPR